jgi:hypothetical protein
MHSTQQAPRGGTKAPHGRRLLAQMRSAVHSWPDRDSHGFQYAHLFLVAALLTLAYLCNALPYKPLCASCGAVIFSRQCHQGDLCPSHSLLQSGLSSFIFTCHLSCAHALCRSPALEWHRSPERRKEYYCRAGPYG